MQAAPTPYPALAVEIGILASPVPNPTLATVPPATQAQMQTIPGSHASGR